MVTSDVVYHLFDVVCGCGPISRSLAIRRYVVSCGCVLWFTFDVTDYLFVVVFRCGPCDNPK